MPAFSSQQVSDQQLQEILAWLGGRPDPTTGVGLFNRYCANCHGSNAAGGVVDQDIRGETLNNVIEAARDGFGGQNYTPRDKFMPGRPVQELSDAELQLIANYL
jgi:mono/diheme cytochrome c family protein